MTKEPVEFTITDADGVPHDYTCQPHGASEGTRLCLRILGMAGEPIGRIAGSNLGKLIDLLQSGAINLDADAKEELARIPAIADLDLDLAQVVRDLVTAIGLAGDEKFFQNLLRYTYRDGKPLANGAVYEEAYTANYMEQIQAVIAVVKVNRFLPLLGMS